MSSKPEVKNTLFEECDQRKQNKTKPNLEMKNHERKGTKQNEIQPINTLPEENEWRKSFSSTKNSYLNHLLPDLKFKQ